MNLEETLAEIEKLNTTVSNLQAALTAVTAERDSLKTENAILNVKMADFDKALAAKLTEMGIRPKALNACFQDTQDHVAIQAAMAQATTPEERGRLARLAREARGHKALFAQ